MDPISAFLEDNKIPLGKWGKQLFTWLTDSFDWFFDGIANGIEITLKMENEIMGAILNDGTDPEKAATNWLKANPGVLDAWLAGVTTFDGGDGMAAAKSAIK